MTGPCNCGDDDKPGHQHVVGGDCYPLDLLRDNGHTPDQPLTLSRVEALRHAKDLLAYLDHTSDDLIVVADWLVTGRADVALAMSEQRFRHYQQAHGGDGPDEMRWRPDLAPLDIDDNTRLVGPTRFEP